MKNIAFFCIPAHGHTNPMVPVARELVSRGHQVRFYSFNQFREKIEKAGAQFVSIDRFLPELDQEQADRLIQVSTTEMTIQDLRTTMNMDSFLDEEIQSFHPDVIYCDSVCFWGKLTAWKYQIPLVVSTSTFAFNQFSSQYQKNSPKELMDLMLGMPKVNRELKKLKKNGHHVKGILSLVQNDNSIDTVVYTSKRVQPYSRTFSSHYAFVGPSVLSQLEPQKEKDRPLIYISMGTVMNNRPDFYRNCIAALKDEPVDVIISCGREMDRTLLGELPPNIQAFDYVDQLEVLSRADVFLTHCGMNSFSESLLSATPMVLYPQTGEQHAVARRAEELGAGVYLKSDSPEGIWEAVLSVLQNPNFASGAMECSRDLRACTGAAGAADFLESAPHPSSEEKDPVDRVNIQIGLKQLLYWALALSLMTVFRLLVGWKYVWVLGVAAGVLNQPYTKAVTKRILT